MEDTTLHFSNLFDRVERTVMRSADASDYGDIRFHVNRCIFSEINRIKRRFNYCEIWILNQFEHVRIHCGTDVVIPSILEHLIILQHLARNHPRRTFTH